MVKQLTSGKTAISDLIASGTKSTSTEVSLELLESKLDDSELITNVGNTRLSARRAMPERF